jgi:hypothetical protein
VTNEVGSYEEPQDACPHCGERDHIEDVPGDDYYELFVSCFGCGYQWHEPAVALTDGE